MRPVLRGMCLFESLIDCTLNLEHVAAMNDALDAQDENEWRIHDAMV
jgi:hypothetical protein